MEEVTAWKCSITGAIFEQPEQARDCEFKAMMNRVSQKLDPMGSISSLSIFEWLSGHLIKNRPAAVSLKNAMDYLVGATTTEDDHGQSHSPQAR